MNSTPTIGDKNICNCTFEDLRIAVKHKFESDDLRKILTTESEPYPRIRCGLCGGYKQIPVGKTHSYTRKQLESGTLTSLDISGSEKVWNVCNLCLHGRKHSVALNRETDDSYCENTDRVVYRVESCKQFTPESAYCRHHDTEWSGTHPTLARVIGVEDVEGYDWLEIIVECETCGNGWKQMWSEK